MSKKSSATKVKLTDVSSLFGNSEHIKDVDSTKEEIIDVSLSDLHEFVGHPFRVVDDEKMDETVESIKKYGVIVPGIVRPRIKGGYEIVSGHRRKHASELAGLKTMPVFVRNLTDDEATIVMVDSNLQREEILPSEKAKAYAMKYDALRHQGCGRDKAMKTLAELDAGKGIGLIEKVRRGLGLADIIYVKNFVGIERIQDENEIENKEKNDEKESANPHKSTEVGNVDFKKSEKSTSRGRKCRLQEVEKADFKKSEKQTSRSGENRLQEVDKTDTKDTNTSYNDSNYNNLRETNHIISNPEGRSVKNVNNMQINSQKQMDEMVVTTWLIKDNISYDDLVAAHPVDKKRIDEIIEIMVDVIVSNSDTVRIGKEDKPREIVRSRFEKLDFSSMEYILGCLKENTTKVHNIKNYLLTTLYNASLTIDNFYSAEVNHDLYGCK